MSGVILLMIIAAGYFGYQALAKNKSTARYITAAVEKGTLVVSVSGSGQVSVSDQIDIRPKVSGDIVYLGIKKGQEVKDGALLAQIDADEAQKAVADAETALETAQLELEELLKPADAYSLIQAENALSQAQDNLTKLKFDQESEYQDSQNAIKKAEDNLNKAYEDAFNSMSNAFLDLPSLITGLNNILYSYEIAKSEATMADYSWNISALLGSVDSSHRDDCQRFINSAENDYKSAREKYDKNFENYKNASRYSDKDVIETLLEETLEDVKAIAEAIKSQSNMLDYWVDYRSQHDLPIYSQVSIYQSDLKSYTAKSNSHLTNLLSSQRSIEDNKEAKSNAERNLKEIEQNNPLDLVAAERNVKEKEESLAKLKAGADELDIRAKKIAVQQKEDILSSSQQNLADHYVRAPFDGLIADINAKKGDSASSSSAIFTIITKQKIAEITLNEVDIAKVKIGQKANISFDALGDLNITGQVVEIDTLGATSQGVVSYGLKIAFDTQDERIKSGMSLSAEIITDAKQNVLLIPSSAIKQQNSASYVQIADSSAVSSALIQPASFRSRLIQTGLSNETTTEVLDGLQEGDIIVTQTISQNQNSNQSLEMNNNQVQMRQMQQQMQRIMH